MIDFQATPTQIDNWIVVVLPPEASQQLPSRGMCMVEGVINGVPFQAPLEPDGKGGHWLGLTEDLRKKAKAEVGSPVMLSVEPSQDWPEPEVPADLQETLRGCAEAKETWSATTAKARWDWIRWIRSTNNLKTRAGRVEKARSKLSSGQRRPCCFNASSCTEPEVSKSGILKES